MLRLIFLIQKATSLNWVHSICLALFPQSDNDIAKMSIEPICKRCRFRFRSVETILQATLPQDGRKNKTTNLEMMNRLW